MAADPYFNVKSTLAEAPYGNGVAVTPPDPGGTDVPTTTTTTAPPAPDRGDPTPTHTAGAPGGYWMIGADGTVYPFGEAKPLGNGPTGANAVDLESTPSGQGYWILTDDGKVSPHGDATGFGTLDTSR